MRVLLFAVGLAVVAGTARTASAGVEDKLARMIDHNIAELEKAIVDAEYRHETLARTVDAKTVGEESQKAAFQQDVEEQKGEISKMTSAVQKSQERIDQNQLIAKTMKGDVKAITRVVAIQTSVTAKKTKEINQSLAAVNLALKRVSEMKSVSSLLQLGLPKTALVQFDDLEKMYSKHRKNAFLSQPQGGSAFGSSNDALNKVLVELRDKLQSSKQDLANALVQYKADRAKEIAVRTAKAQNADDQVKQAKTAMAREQARLGEAEEQKQDSEQGVATTTESINDMANEKETSRVVTEKEVEVAKEQKEDLAGVKDILTSNGDTNSR